jgi:hypothetical protein
MGAFHRNQSNDVLFLMPVRLASEKPPRGKVMMLYCDAAGRVYTSVISRSVYDLARGIAEGMERSHKPFAILGLEAGPGRFVPAAVEIGPKEVWALEHILEHALKTGRLPDILKKYIKPIIKLGEDKREAVLAEYRISRRRGRLQATPRVLDRLPYYSEHDIEISVPIYKAEYRYPLIVLKRLLSDEKTPQSFQRLLVLDSDGDLAAVKVSSRLMDSIAGAVKKRNQKNGKDECVLISKYPEGLAVDHMVISQLQKKALDTITRYFEETGDEKQQISATARRVLTKARDRILTPAK